MPNIKSAIKRMRSDERKHARNHVWLSELKTLSKKLQANRTEPEKAREIAGRFVSRLDKAANKGAIPKGRADRKKARIAALLSSFEKKTAKKKSTKKKKTEE